MHEGCGFTGKADTEQSVDGKGRVSDPGVAIVPIAAPADLFRETTGRSGNDRAGGFEGQELQGQSGPGYHFAPAPGVTAV